MLRDFLYFKIDNGLCVACMIGGIFYILLGYSPMSLTTASLTALTILTIGFCLNLLNVIGAGDVKFLTALGFWISPENLGDFFIHMTLIGGVVCGLELGFGKKLFWLRHKMQKQIHDAVKNVKILNKFLHLFDLIESNEASMATVWEKPIPYGVAIAGTCFWQFL